MELILIRHGKAEERSEKAKDAKRDLSADGKKKLLKTMPSLGLLIKNTGKAQIWTSQLDRATQSADVISKLFNIQEVEHFDFISDGNFSALTDALAKMKPSSTVIVVGHEPFLGNWTKQLCGQTLPFKKGAVSGIKINKFDPLTAELLWFYQPQALGRLGENNIKK